MCRSLQNLSRREAWKQRDKIKAKVQELQAESFEYRFNAIVCQLSVPLRLRTLRSA